jgi:hypothetical protein
MLAPIGGLANGMPPNPLSSFVGATLVVARGAKPPTPKAIAAKGAAKTRRAARLSRRLSEGLHGGFHGGFHTDGALASRHRVVRRRQQTAIPRPAAARAKLMCCL